VTPTILRDRRAWTWQWTSLLAAAAVALSAIALFWYFSADRAPEALGPIRGLRLGMAPAHARSSLRTEARGSFRGEAMGEDFALVWAPASEPSSGPLKAARLEFHSGQLVALRLTLSPDAPEADGPALEATEISVLTRERSGPSVLLTWIARSCPTHADEARRRLGEHR
jgi:hypothetical protein